jgi:hypothetical protein
LEFENLYLMENKNIPGLVKFGYTKNHPRERAKQLSAVTGVPGHYTTLKYWRVKDGLKWEQFVFRKLASHRQTGEFLKLSPKAAIDKIEIILSEAGATEDYDAHELEQSQRRQKMFFEEERKKTLKQNWEKNKDKFWDQSRKEAEKRLGYRRDHLNKQIKEIEEQSFAVKSQGAVDTIWVIFSMAFLMLPIIIAAIVKNVLGIKDNDRWLSDAIDGGKSGRKIDDLKDRRRILDDESERFFSIAEKNFFRIKVGYGKSRVQANDPQSPTPNRVGAPPNPTSADAKYLDWKRERDKGLESE